VLESKRGGRKRRSRGNKLPKRYHRMPWPVLLSSSAFLCRKWFLTPRLRAPRHATSQLLTTVPYRLLLLPANLRRGRRCNVMLASPVNLTSRVRPAKRRVTARLAPVRHVFDDNESPTGATFTGIHCSPSPPQKPSPTPHGAPTANEKQRQSSCCH